ncbi:hypothetical protein V5O48_012660, partial [Marasmius crinis-equi]
VDYESDSKRLTLVPSGSTIWRAMTFHQDKGGMEWISTWIDVSQFSRFVASSSSDRVRASTPQPLKIFLMLVEDVDGPKICVRLMSTWGFNGVPPNLAPLSPIHHPAQ